MRPEVRTFVADGPLPDWDASEEEIDRRVQQLNADFPFALRCRVISNITGARRKRD